MALELLRGIEKGKEKRMRQEGRKKKKGREMSKENGGHEEIDRTYTLSWKLVKIEMPSMSRKVSEELFVKRKRCTLHLITKQTFVKTDSHLNLVLLISL